MSIQIILYAAFFTVMLFAPVVYIKYLVPAKMWMLTRVNKFLLRKSFNAAMADAKQLKTKGYKVYLLLWKGDWEAIPKQNFKAMWHAVPGMKKFTIQQWQKKMIEV